MVREIKIDHAGTHPGNAIHLIDLKDLVHLRDGNDNGSRTERNSAAGQTGAGTTGHHSAVMFNRDLHDGSHFFDRDRITNRPGVTTVEH